MKTWQKVLENKKLIKKYLIREKVIDGIREFFKKSGFHEVFTPILVPVPSSEPNLEVFETELRTFRGLKRKGFLIMSPEYSIKKLLSAGFGSVFEITKAFRNEEEISPSHNHEFTILEWYRINANYKDIMKDFENMFLYMLKKTNNCKDIKRWRYQGREYDLSTPWRRLRVTQAFKIYAGIDERVLKGEKLIEAASKKGYKTDKNTTWEQVFYQIFLNEVEPEIKKENKPFFLYDYPVFQAVLAKRKKKDPDFAERFEVYLAGLELGNCFSELLDAKELEKRLKSDIRERKKAGKTEFGIDKDLIKAQESGMPEVSGIAVGVDRLVMLAGDFSDIKQTLLFPTSEIFDLEGE